MVFGEYMGGEKPTDCTAAVEMLRDPRARYWWDDDRHLGRKYGRSVGAPFPERPSTDNDVLWDSYLLFDSQAAIKDGVPSKPVFWMHQLWGVPDSVGPKLDTRVLKQRILALLQ